MWLEWASFQNVVHNRFNRHLNKLFLYGIKCKGNCLSKYRIRFLYSFTTSLTDWFHQGQQNILHVYPCFSCLIRGGIYTLIMYTYLILLRFQISREKGKPSSKYPWNTLPSFPEINRVDFSNFSSNLDKNSSITEMFCPRKERKQDVLGKIYTNTEHYE